MSCSCQKIPVLHTPRMHAQRGKLCGEHTCRHGIACAPQGAVREAAARLQSATEAADSAAAELKRQEALLADQVEREEQAERQALEAERAAQETRLKVD